jgi:hypothetical protein
LEQPPDHGPEMVLVLHHEQCRRVGRPDRRGKVPGAWRAQRGQDSCSMAPGLIVMVRSE